MKDLSEKGWEHDSSGCPANVKGSNLITTTTTTTHTHTKPTEKVYIVCCIWHTVNAYYILKYTVKYIRKTKKRARSVI
jgi:hypothetical protein